MIASFFTSLLLGGLLSGATPTTKPTDAKPADSKKKQWRKNLNGFLCSMVKTPKDGILMVKKQLARHGK